MLSLAVLNTWTQTKLKESLYSGEVSQEFA